MKAKEYLKQAYRLDQRINSNIKEVGELRAMAGSISSPQLSADKVQTSHNGDAPFERALVRIWEMEAKIDAEIDLYVDLKNQIREVISQIDNVDEQMVLRYRYIHLYHAEGLQICSHGKDREHRGIGGFRHCDGRG